MKSSHYMGGILSQLDHSSKHIWVAEAFRADGTTKQNTKNQNISLMMYSIAYLKTDIEHTGAYCPANVIIIMTQFPKHQLRQ